MKKVYKLVPGESMSNYIYQGFYIVPKGNQYEVQTARVGRAKLYTARSLIEAKMWIEENSSEEAHMRAILAHQKKSRGAL